LIWGRLPDSDHAHFGGRKLADASEPVCSPRCLAGVATGERRPHNRCMKRKRVREPTTVPHSGFPLVGSEVLEVVGSGGVPKRDMHDIIHSPDDGIAVVRLGPQQGASVSFRPDPEIGDAGADLAEEFGENYLRSATTGEDMSELENPTEPDPNEFAGPLVLERPPAKPSRRRRRHRPGA
jgi:hypothetical protein